MLDQIATWADKYQALANIIGLVCGGPLIILLIQKLMLAVRHRDEAQAHSAHLEKNIVHLEKEIEDAGRKRDIATQNLRRVLDVFDDHQDEIWIKKPIYRPDNYSKLSSSIPIIVLANLKGGVGKTTLATNLAAYFERRRNERVLAIDLDYQGSLSSMLLNQATSHKKRNALGIKDLLGGNSDANKLISQSFPIRETKKDSRLLECEASFSNFEMQVLFNSIVQNDGSDYRYNLAKVLLSDEIQDRFDRIIIDAPPRITTGFVASLCAATHLVIPTILDVLSAERVGLFLSDLKRWQDAEIIGKFENNLFVVGTMKSNSVANSFKDSEKQAIDEIKKQLKIKLGSDHYFLEGTLIPRKEDIAEVAGLRIAYYGNEGVFNPLGDALFEKTKSLTRANHETRSTQQSFAAL